MSREHIQLPIISTGTNVSKLPIGNSVFTDDIWDLSPLINSPEIHPYRKIIDFTFAKSENFKEILKLYVYHKMGEAKPLTILDRVKGYFPIFIKFADYYGINSFSHMTYEIYIDFITWLKNEYFTMRKKRISPGAGYLCSSMIQEIINTGQIKDWDVPKTNILNGISTFNLWFGSKKDIAQIRKQSQHKPIPVDILNKVIDSAINKEANIIVRSGIIIQSQTGLRISEVLSIKVGCLQKMKITIPST